MYLLVLKFILCMSTIIVKSAWVEIPQVPNKKSEFVFGSPKVSFPNSKFGTTTPTNYKMLMTAPTTTLPVLTTTPTPPINISKFTDRTEDSIKAPPQEKFSDDAFDDGFSHIRDETEIKNEETSDYPGFLPFLNSIQQTLTMKAKKSLKSKISLLTHLRDNLLANIDERMTNLWSPPENLPEARGHHDDHEMEFPSHEGALITIGFLTFAVFLIKLVLKLIHALKNKQTTGTIMGTTGLTGTGTTATAFIGRRKRDLDDYDSMQILQLIDEFKFS